MQQPNNAFNLAVSIYIISCTQLIVMFVQTLNKMEGGNLRMQPVGVR